MLHNLIDLSVLSQDLTPVYKSPSCKVGELDNRGSHFYLAMYWAQALASQNDDADLKARFTPIAEALAKQEATIVAELNGAQGHAVELGSYYYPTPELVADIMRPSKTLNAIVEGV